MNLHYLTGRSLTQRAFFGLCGNNAILIAGTQMAIYAISATALYFLLRPRKRGWRDVTIALSIALIFTSYTMNLSAMAICAEPIFLALLLVTPCLIFQAEHRPTMVIAVGTLFVFSKNLAPYVLLGAIICRLVSLGERPRRSFVITQGVLALIACTSLWLTAKFDTSVDLNIANNMFVRVFPDDDVAERFQERFGMPPGEYIQDCGGEFITAPCFAGRSILD